jgi:hypothetical protein
MSPSRPASCAQHRQRGVDRRAHLRIAGAAAPVALHHDHLDDLAAPGDQFRQGPPLGVGHRPGLGADALGEQREEGGVDAVGLGEPARGAGEVADLAGVHDGDRQARGDEVRGEPGLVAAGRLEHYQGRR